MNTKLYGLVDVNTGTIKQTIRGSGIELPKDENWHDFTEDPWVITLFDAHHQRQVKRCPVKKCIVLKDRYSLELDKRFFKADGQDKVVVTLNGPEDSNKEIEVLVNSKSQKLKSGESFDITSDVAQRLTVAIKDYDVYVPHEGITIFAEESDAF